ncbi:MAG: MaoC/PaaZ C-terminal domain-containing protein [Pseudorhodoplanes sp.]|jgi:acyl dehydratase|nr:MaoC/PaaZ C-terminal domain-containing protein [Pseudorhodoplanes sp.]
MVPVHGYLCAIPGAARAAGFDRPVLHGLASFGIAEHALLKTICDYEPERIAAMAERSSAPVYPGETIRTEIRRDGGIVSYGRVSLGAI